MTKHFNGAVVILRVVLKMQSKSMPLELDLFVMAANILLAFFLFLYLELFIVT